MREEISTARPVTRGQMRNRRTEQYMRMETPEGRDKVRWREDEMMPFSLWALLPPLFSLGTAAGLWMVYFVAVYNETIVPLSTATYRGGNGSLYPPFISVAGNFPPASCFLSEVMNLAAFLGFIICILRYLQLSHRSACLNFVSMLAFCVGCFGMTLVGNFQLFSMPLLHNVGTLMTFGLGTLYCWVQSYITLAVSLKKEGRAVAIARFLLSAAITLCFILTYALVHFSIMHAARCQWALVMFFLAFIGTFAVEFRHIRLEMCCTERQSEPSQGWDQYQGWDRDRGWDQDSDQDQDRGWDRDRDQDRDRQ